MINFDITTENDFEITSEIVEGGAAAGRSEVDVTAPRSPRAEQQGTVRGRLRSWLCVMRGRTGGERTMVF